MNSRPLLSSRLLFTSRVCDFICSSFEVQTITMICAVKQTSHNKGAACRGEDPAGTKSIAPAFSLSSVNRRHGAGYCTDEEMLDSKSLTGAAGSLLQSGLITVLKS